MVKHIYVEQNEEDTTAIYGTCSNYTRISRTVNCECLQARLGEYFQRLSNAEENSGQARFGRQAHPQIS